MQSYRTHLTMSPIEEDLFVGSLFVLISIGCLLPYIPCLIVMHDDSQLNCMSCYRLMFHQGLTDVIQLLGHMVAGFVTMGQIEIPLNLNKLFGGFVNGLGWMSYLAFATVIAFERCIHVKLPQFNFIFSLSNIKYWISLCWCIGFMWFLCYLSPHVDFIYFVDSYGFYYNVTDYGIHVQNIGFWFNSSQMLTIGVCYCLVLIWARKIASLDENASVIEKSLMKQCALIFLYTSCFEIYFDTSPYFMPKHKYSSAFISVLWILNGAVNPIVYLTLNYTLRSKVHQLWCANNIQPL